MVQVRADLEAFFHPGSVALIGAVDRQARFVQERLGRVEPQNQVAHRLDRIRILPGVIEPAIDPGARLYFNEFDRLRDGAKLVGRQGRLGRRASG